jgi:trk system potassium uptake protein TrkA
MKIIIVGCGRTGSRLARRLSEGGMDVAVVDEVREAFISLGPNFAGNTYQGSGLDAEVLRQAGVESADAVLAVAGGDNRNLMIAQMVKYQFGIARAVARLRDPVRAFHYRELGIETLCTTTIIEGLLELWVKDGALPALPGAISVCGDRSVLDEY